MSYYTEYNLKIVEGDIELPEILDELKEDEFEELLFAINLDGSSRHETTTAGVQNDVAILSVSHPEVVFALYGSGDSFNDTWVHYFKAGKGSYQEAEVVFPVYNETELEPFKNY